MNWSLDTAEQSVAYATATAMPAMLVLNGPLLTLDNIICRGIDIVEQQVPAINLPPQLVSFYYYFYVVVFAYLLTYLLSYINKLYFIFLQ